MDWRRFKCIFSRKIDHNYVVRICKKNPPTRGNFFLGGRVAETVSKIGNILTYTCPNHSGVGVIDSPDRFEHVLHSYCIHQVLEKISDTKFSLSDLKKCLKIVFFGVFKAFISNFLYYNLHWWKLKVITRPQYALLFFIRPLQFFLGSGWKFESER